MKLNKMTWVALLLISAFILFEIGTLIYQENYRFNPEAVQGNLDARE